MKYHKKLLKIFTQDELDLLVEASEGSFSKNKNDEIHLLIITTNKIQVEIYTDCEAEKCEHALIFVLYDYGYIYPNIISKDEFWKIFKNSKIEDLMKIKIDE